MDDDLQEPFEVGQECWTWIFTQNRDDVPIVKKVKVKEIFTVMILVEANGNAIEVPRTELYVSQEEALDELHKKLDGIEEAL